jgi:hypothetical protein
MTARQSHIMQVVALHDGDTTAAADELRVSRQYVDKVMTVSRRKLHDWQAKRSAGRKRRLPEDRRGQTTIPAPDGD